MRRLVSGLVLLAGCSRAPTPPLPSISLAGPRCTDEAPLPLTELTIAVRLVRNVEVPESNALRIAAEMAAFWRPYGILLQLDGPIRTTRTPHGLGGSPGADLRRAMRSTRDLVRAHALPRRPDTVVVVVLPRVAAPRSEAEHALGDVTGFTLVPWARELSKAIGYDTFTPLVLLPATPPVHPDTPSLGPAHELGHVLGLEHGSHAHDLMTTPPPTCIPILSPLQRMKLLETLPRLHPEPP